MSDDLSSQAAPRPGEYRPVDEHANLITHGLGLVLSIAASSLLMTLAINERKAINVVA